MDVMERIKQQVEENPVVIFMKAAASKNRVVDKIEGLLSLMNG